MTSYLVCATQRSGSTLLCELLAQTGIAGDPNEHLLMWMKERERTDPAFWLEALQHITNLGSTPNGVFGCKVMASTFPEAMNLLRLVPEAKSKTDWEIATRAFHNPKVIRVHRRNRLRQAISNYIASVTKSFHGAQQGDSKDPFLGEALSTFDANYNRDVPFDYDAIREFRCHIDKGENYWDDLFAAAGVEPLSITYEDYIDAQRETTMQILDFLEIPYRGEQIKLSPHLRRLSNEVNETFYACYQRVQKSRPN